MRETGQLEAFFRKCIKARLTYRLPDSVSQTFDAPPASPVRYEWNRCHQHSAPEQQRTFDQIKRAAKSAIQSLVSAPTVRVMGSPEATDLTPPVKGIPTDVPLAIGHIYVLQSCIGTALGVCMLIFHQMNDPFLIIGNTLNRTSHDALLVTSSTVGESSRLPASISQTYGASSTAQAVRESQEQTHTCRTRDKHETRRKVGKLTFNFAGSSRSPPVPKLWKQPAKRGCQFSWLSGSWVVVGVFRQRRLSGSQIVIVRLLIPRHDKPAEAGLCLC